MKFQQVVHYEWHSFIDYLLFVIVTGYYVGVIMTVSFTGPVWTAHGIVRLEGHKATGLKFTLTPNYTLGSDYIYGQYTFARFAQYEFQTQFVETDPFRAYKQSINIFFDELKKLDDPKCLEALKNIELVDEVKSAEQDKDENWDCLENMAEPIKISEDEVEQFFQDMKKEFATD